MKGITTIIIIIAIAVVAFFMLRDGTISEGLPQNINGQAQLIEGGANNVSSDIVVEIDDTAIDATPEIIVVIYNDEGFTPKDISVSIGQTVRFVNESSGNMWVASDNHPSHKILPEFDNKKAISGGESYEFAFTEAGEWSYHNHIKPSAVGTISVE
jgi:plastocyanin